MDNILIEKVENGFIVKENYNDRNPQAFASICKTLVFNSNRALNKYINEKFKIETK